MFTGLIEETGHIAAIEPVAGGKRFTIACRLVLEGLKIGDSIAVSGACQTVEQIGAESFTVFSIPETLARTNFNDLKIGDPVNLERALRLGDRLGGHLVQGHVEGTATVVSVKHGDAYDIVLHYASPYIVPKGSVALNGISLTVMESFPDNRFRVQIIPETLRKTDIGYWQPGARINIETDYLIKAFDHIRNFREHNPSGIF
ncbi:MAG: riboflavin synthase [Leptospiraceae bacterium]|nr:riboflavin synthase [Leptospiraceae bacterium]